MARKKKWYFYNLYKRVSGNENDDGAFAISEQLLPKRTRKHECANATNYPRLLNFEIGQVADLVFGDPRLLRRCKLVEKDVSQMPEEVKHIMSRPYDPWWTLRWRGKLLFVNALRIAPAKDAKF